MQKNLERSIRIISDNPIPEDIKYYAGKNWTIPQAKINEKRSLEILLEKLNKN